MTLKIGQRVYKFNGVLVRPLELEGYTIKAIWQDTSTDEVKYELNELPESLFKRDDFLLTGNDIIKYLEKRQRLIDSFSMGALIDYDVEEIEEIKK